MHGDGNAPDHTGKVRERALEHEVERPQPEQGERVGREHEERVPGDAVDRRHGVDGEDDVRREDGERDHGQRREHAASALPDRQPRAAVVGRDRHEAAQQAHSPAQTATAPADAQVPQSGV